MSKIINIVNQTNKPNEIAMFLRRPHRPEILIYLCGECNLRCKFCQDQDRYDQKISLQAIEHRLQLFKQAVAEIPENDIDVVVFGGEIFQDKYSDEIINKIDWFYKQIDQYLNTIGKKHQFYTTTNLAYDKIDRVIELCKRNNVFVRASFDLFGRYKSQKIIDKVLRNLQLVKQAQLPVLVNFVAYKPNIERIYNKSENYDTWLYLYNNYPMCFGEYTDFVKQNSYQVTERELGEFVIHLYKNYPKITNVQNMLHPLYKPRDYIYCAYNVVINDSISWQCCDRNKAITKFIKNHKCLQCKYYDGCYGTCPRIFQDSDCCHIKMLLDYASEHRENIIFD